MSLAQRTRPSTLGEDARATWATRLGGWVRALRASVYTMLLGRALIAAAVLVALAMLGSHFERPIGGAGADDDGGATIALVPVAHAAESPGVASTDGGDASTNAAPAPPSPAGSASGRATPESPVFLNLASESELRRLPGVGAKRADAILALRKKLGRFRRLEDLMRVKGIGRAAMRKWRPLVRLDAPSEDQDAGAPR